MRFPDSLAALAEDGIIQEVLRPLMSGKEAQIYLVRSGGEARVAKIYKEAQNRSFKHRTEYTEGRKVRNSRDQRAISKRTRHGRAQDEVAWRSTEVDMIYRLQAAGVRVPVPYHFVDGVLVMELVTDAAGNPAPRLGDVRFSPDEARRIYDRVLREVVRMLCAGVVHGDLSDFNVLLGTDGPVVIDFPQAIDAAGNQGARKLLLRDVDNLHRFLLRNDPSAQRLPFAEEIWDLYERNLLTPDTRLTGTYLAASKQADTALVVNLIADANRDEQRRRQALGLKAAPGLPARADVAPRRRAELGRQGGGRGGGAQPVRPRPGDTAESRGRTQGSAAAPSTGSEARDRDRRSHHPVRGREQASGPRQATATPGQPNAAPRQAHPGHAQQGPRPAPRGVAPRGQRPSTSLPDQHNRVSPETGRSEPPGPNGRGRTKRRRRSRPASIKR